MAEKKKHRTPADTMPLNEALQLSESLTRVRAQLATLRHDDAATPALQALERRIIHELSGELPAQPDEQ
jgi:hypothetical protein